MMSKALEVGRELTRLCRRDARNYPEGMTGLLSRRDQLNVARQFIAWYPRKRDPSRRARSDPYPRLIRLPDRGTPIGSNHTVPYGTDPSIGRVPGNKLPGY